MSLIGVEHKQTAVVYSGELSKKRFLNWIMMQAAGKGYTEKYREYEGYYCKDEVKPAICKWLGNYMWLYNNLCGNKFEEIASLIRTKVIECKADICIIYKDFQVTLQYSWVKKHCYRLLSLSC